MIISQTPKSQYHEALRLHRAIRYYLAHPEAQGASEQIRACRAKLSRMSDPILKAAYDTLPAVKYARQRAALRQEIREQPAIA